MRRGRLSWHAFCHAALLSECPLLALISESPIACNVRYWVKRTWLFAPHMSAFDPKRTSTRHWVVNGVCRHKKALSTKACDRPHSPDRLVGPSFNARNAGQYFRPTVGGSLWGVTRSGPFLTAGESLPDGGKVAQSLTYVRFGIKRTYQVALHTYAFDPKRTSARI